MKVFLGFFEKLRKATISFVMSVCPPPLVLPFFHMELGPTGQIFIKFDILVFFENLFRKSSFFQI